MKVLYIEWLPEEVEKEFNKEQFVYHSGDDDLYLVTDKTFELLDAKYNLTNLEEDGDRLCSVYDSIEEWIGTEYEQDYYTFMGEEYLLADFAETTNEQLTYIVDDTQEPISFIESDNWIDDVEKCIYIELSTYISGRLRDALIEGNKKGLDIEVIKMATINL